jgi:hypothetical protein
MISLRVGSIFGREVVDSRGRTARLLSDTPPVDGGRR